MIKSIWNAFLKFFGDIKVYKFPFFFLYDPGSYRVTSAEVRRVLEVIRSGDILIRGYVNYLDGYFIPGYFSHAGLYLGPTSRETTRIPKGVPPHYFYEGDQTVIHSMAEGVFMEDILGFCKCDFLLILRRNDTIEPNISFEASNQAVCERAATFLGKAYDFQFDFSDVRNMSCTELVYESCRSYINAYDVRLKTRRALFVKRKILLPDDFITSKFVIPFSSQSIDQKKLTEILKKNNSYEEEKKDQT